MAGFSLARFVWRWGKARSFAGLMLAAAVVAGCSDHAIHVEKLQAAFESSTPEVKGEIDKAAGEIKAGDFKSALATLQKVAFGTKMTAEQREILQDTIHKAGEKVPAQK